MKRFLVLIALLLIPSLAFAGWNLRQKDDGSTVWTNEDSKDVPVGDAGLTVVITDISTAGSAYITSHKAGNLKTIYAVVSDTLGTAPVVLSFHISDYTTNATASGPQSVSTGATITIPDGGAGGDMVSVSPLIDKPDGETTTTVNQGDVIIVYTNGASTGTASAAITYIIE